MYVETETQFYQIVGLTHSGAHDSDIYDEDDIHWDV